MSSPRASSAPKRKRGHSARVLLGVAAAACLAVGGYYGVVAWREASATSAARTALLAAIDVETGKQEPDGGELSRLAAALGKQPDHETAHDLVLAAARIELARDRVDRAWRLLSPLASAPEAAPVEQALGARVLLRLHEAGGSDRAEDEARLQQVLGLVQAAGAGSLPEPQQAELQWIGWLAATRLGDSGRAGAFATALRERHSGSLEARAAELAGSFDPTAATGALDALVAEFPRCPPELSALQVLARLQRGDLAGAVPMAEALLSRAPGVLVVRLAASAVFAACAAGHANDEAQRAPWLARRDAQLDWLLQRSPAEDPRRAGWAALRESR